jgi:hypothetical protein
MLKAGTKVIVTYLGKEYDGEITGVTDKSMPYYVEFDRDGIGGLFFHSDRTWRDQSFRVKEEPTDKCDTCAYKQAVEKKPVVEVKRRKLENYVPVPKEEKKIGGRRMLKAGTKVIVTIRGAEYEGEITYLSVSQKTIADKIKRQYEIVFAHNSLVFNEDGTSVIPCFATFRVKETSKDIVIGTAGERINKGAICVLDSTGNINMAERCLNG